MFLGTILDNILGKSCLNPGSYSIVVTAAVEPETKIVIIPSLSFDRESILEASGVISIISPSPLDLMKIVLVITCISFLYFIIHMIFVIIFTILLQKGNLKLYFEVAYSSQFNIEYSIIYSIVKLAKLG